MKNINKQRRQQFLYTELYEAIANDFEEACAIEPPDFAVADLRRVASFGSDFDNTLDALMLEYTAGAPIEEVKANYPGVVDAFEKWC